MPKKEIIKILRCKCGTQRYHSKNEIQEPPTPCERCGKPREYSANWFIKTTTNGKRHLEKVGAQHRQAERVLSAQKEAAVIDKFLKKPEHEEIQLSTAIEIVYNEKWRKHKDGDKSRRRAKGLLKLIGSDILLSQINDITYKTIIKRLTERGAKEANINRYKAALRTVLRHFQKPVEFIKTETEPPGRIRVITYKEEKIVNQAFKDHPEMPDLVTVLIDTGMRPSELIKLPTADINFDTNLIIIWENKTSNPRSVPMTKRVRKILKNRNDREKPFSITLAQAEIEWANMRKQIGYGKDFSFRLYCCRHTCATRLLEAGIDIYTVQKWLGHKSIKSTERYALFNPNHLQKGVVALEKRQKSTNRQQSI